MAEKVVAQEADLQNHIRTDWKAAHGIWTNIAPRLLQFVRLQGTGYIGKPLIQMGVSSSSSVPSVTFDVAFKTGTTPMVMAISTTDYLYVCKMAASATAWSAQLRSHDGSGGTASTCYWIAIGEKA